MGNATAYVFGLSLSVIEQSNLMRRGQIIFYPFLEVLKWILDKTDEMKQSDYPEGKEIDTMFSRK